MCPCCTVCAHGGLLLAATAALVACNDCVRNIPLFIVQGLIWANNFGFFFFLVLVSVFPAGRFLFLVVAVVRCLVVASSCSVRVRFSSFGARPCH
jgi:hypothetical protein